jgi:zinc D-Ala-D-Ala carboxypeptidase
MDNPNIKSLMQNIVPAALVFVVLGGLLIYQFTQISALRNDVLSLKIEIASTTDALSFNTSRLSQNITDLRAETIGLSDTLSSTQQNIQAVETKVGGVEQTVGSISGAVGTLQKLSQIDAELLKKYSKIYFMNENYVPAHLIDIQEDYLYNVSDAQKFLTEAWPYLKNMLDAAKVGGKELYVKSAYRSFSEQQTLKSTYTVVYGAGTANSFSADQGYSEHQLGTTVDFVAVEQDGKLAGFDDTEQYQWLLSNAHRFGFILSYPKGNAYYIYEPWHWRFVGVKLAILLHNNKLSFYDIDQREIDAYLINIFD